MNLKLKKTLLPALLASLFSLGSNLEMASSQAQTNDKIPTAVRTLNSDISSQSNPETIKAVINWLQTQPDKRRAFNSLSPSARSAITTNLKVAKTVKNKTFVQDRNSPTARAFGVGTRSSTNCGTVTSSTEGYSLAGLKLWSYHQQLYACWDGSTLLTAHRQNRWGDVHVILWEFVGHTGNWERWDGNTKFTAWTQGSFKVCAALGNIGCVQNVYPTLETWIDSRGNYG